MRGAGLAAVARGGWYRFAGTGNSVESQDSSSHGDGGVTPAARQLWHEAEQIHLFNLRGRQGCQDCKCQIRAEIFGMETVSALPLRAERVGGSVPPPTAGRERGAAGRLLQPPLLSSPQDLVPSREGHGGLWPWPRGRGAAGGSPSSSAASAAATTPRSRTGCAMTAASPCRPWSPRCPCRPWRSWMPCSPSWW